MNKEIFTFENITNLVTPIAKKYGVKNIYLFGSYLKYIIKSTAHLIIRFARQGGLCHAANCFFE